MTATSERFSIGLVGAGLIGRFHAEIIAGSGFCHLGGVAEPSDAGRRFCQEKGIAWFADHRRMLAEARPDAVLVATPNDTHLPIALDVIGAGIPVLVEKPIASTVADGEKLAEAARRAGVPVLVGHHRRYNPIIVEVEDTAAIILRLANGALVTISLCDTAVTPWSWDLSSGELPSYPAQPAPITSHFISGTEASLTLPTLDLWRYPGKRSWFEAIERGSVPVERGSPYILQLAHLRDVAQGRAAPIIDAADGTRTLRATLAVNEAAASGRRVVLDQH